MSTNAANRVFDIPELLENILLEVALIHKAADPVDEVRIREGSLGTSDHVSLFPLQRVSKTFKATIESSPVLRREMYGARTTQDLDVDLAYNGSCFVGSVLIAAAGTRVARAWNLDIIHGKNEYKSWEGVQILASDRPAIYVSFLFEKGEMWVQPGNTFGDVYKELESTEFVG